MPQERPDLHGADLSGAVADKTTRGPAWWTPKTATLKGVHYVDYRR